MKVEITKHRYLNSLSRAVVPGEILDSGNGIPETLLATYISNGIAKEITASEAPQNKEEGE